MIALSIACYRMKISIYNYRLTYRCFFLSIDIPWADFEVLVIWYFENIDVFPIFLLLKWYKYLKLRSRDISVVYVRRINHKHIYLTIISPVNSAQFVR